MRCLCYALLISNFDWIGLGLCFELVTTMIVVRSLNGSLAPLIGVVPDMAGRRLFFDDLSESKDDSQ